jgi:hypothetical protein
LIDFFKQRIESAYSSASQDDHLPSPVPTEQSTSELQQHQLHSASLSATGKSLKLRATDRQTPSQGAALSKLKEKSQRQPLSSHPRKVANYARQDNFLL